MYKSIACAFTIAAILSACDQGGKNLASTVLPKSLSKNPARFEVRDFVLSRNTKEYGVVSTGRGTIVAKDEEISKGNLKVFLTAERAGKDNEPWRTLVIMRDGLGTIETNDYQNKEDSKSSAVNYSNWNLIGYSRLQPGEFIQSSNLPVDESLKRSSSNLPRFEVLDIVTTQQSFGTGGGINLRATGTLISRDERLKKGLYHVLMAGRPDPESEDLSYTAVILRDGIGSLKTGHHVKDDEKQKKISFKDWSIVGYESLEPGRILPAKETVDKETIAETTSVAQYEVRDFIISKSEETYGGASFNGRGTLIAKNDSHKEGNYLVFLSAKEEHEGGREFNTVVLMRDGLGTIITSDYRTKKEVQDGPPVKYSSWNIEGISHLLPGVIQKKPQEQSN